MKKYLILSIIALCNIAHSQTGIVNNTSALLAANNWYTLETSGNYTITDVNAIYYNGHISRYVVNYSNNGFVMTSAYNAMNPILGFSTEHNFNTVNQSPELKFWLGLYDVTIDSLISNNDTNSFFSSRWNNLLTMQIPNNYKAQYSAGNYLIHTKWGQWDPYNSMVNASNGACGTCPTGCVATAMGQIMKNWNVPILGFDWCIMPDYLSEDANLLDCPNNGTFGTETPQVEINAVAKLLDDIGSSVHMNYCEGGQCESSAMVSTNALNAFINYGYNANYDDMWTSAWHNLWYGETWNQLLDNNIDSNLPVLYTADDPNDGGHAWVLDGYSSNDNSFFHMNFGWDGCDDSYFYLDDINTPIGKFVQDEGAIYGIRPNNPVDCNTSYNNLSGIASYGTIVGGTISNNGNLTILNGPVTFAACNEIVLNSGFTSTGNFTAKIINPYCAPLNGYGAKNAITKTAPLINNNYQLVNNNNQNTNQTLDTNIISSLQVLPNPNNGNMQVVYQISGNTIGTFSIYDMLGKQLLSYPLYSGKNTLTISEESLNQGIYFYKAFSGNKQIAADKIVIIK